MPGILAAGDVRHGSVKRVAAAVGEGATTVQLVQQGRTPGADEAAGARAPAEADGRLRTPAKPRRRRARAARSTAAPAGSVVVGAAAF